MKTLTPSQVAMLMEAAITEREKLSATVGQPFIGMSAEDVLADIGRRIGDKWMVHRPTALHWTKADFFAVANNRFFRETGLILLMGLCIVLLTLGIFTTTLPLIPLWLYEILVAICAGVFVFIFTKKRKQARRAFFDDMQVHGYNYPWLTQEMGKKDKRK